MFMMLCILNFGTKQLENDIDIYLTSLINDLKPVCETSVVVRMHDGQRKESFNLRVMLVTHIFNKRHKSKLQTHRILDE